MSNANREGKKTTTSRSKPEMNKYEEMQSSDPTFRKRTTYWCQKV